jgi:hypothetical protein
MTASNTNGLMQSCTTQLPINGELVAPSGLLIYKVREGTEGKAATNDQITSTTKRV